MKRKQLIIPRCMFQLYGLRGVCKLDDCAALSDLHVYPDLMQGEGHGILF